MSIKTDNTVLSNGIVRDNIFFPQKKLQSGTLRIVLTTRCNYQCKYCFAEGEENKDFRELPLNELKKVIKVSKEFGITNIKLTGGEPLLYTYMEELLDYIRKIEIPYIDLTTNISMLNDSNIKLLNKYKVNALTLSLNTLKKEKFEYLSGFNNYNLMIKNLHNVMKKFNGKVRINCIVFDEGYKVEDYDEILQLCKENGLGLRFVEPSIVENLPITYKKEKFNEYVEYLRAKSDRIIKSDCKSVEYFFIGDWYVTIMHSLCDNRLCDSCPEYMYIRVTSDLKLKPCLARRDTEVEINTKDEQTIKEAFIEAISYMGIGVQYETV